MQACRQSAAFAVLEVLRAQGEVFSELRSPLTKLHLLRSRVPFLAGGIDDQADDRKQQLASVRRNTERWNEGLACSQFSGEKIARIGS